MCSTMTCTSRPQWRRHGCSINGCRMKYGGSRVLLFFQAEDGIRDSSVTGVQTCALPILRYSGTALFQADVFTSSEADAKHVVDSAGRFLAMYRTVAQSVGAKGADADVKAEIGRASCRERV